MSVKGTVFNIQKFCIHDGDGIRTTVFLKGCPLKCLWCHNPESQSPKSELIYHSHLCTGCGRCVPKCPASAREIANGRIVVNREKCVVCGECAEVCFAGANEKCGYETTAEEAFAAVVRDRIFYETSGGGMTVSGGEPSMQPEFTLELLRLANENGVSSAIETCGFGSRGFFESARALGCVFLFDLKCLNPRRHREFTGAPLEPILDNLKMLFDSKADVILRLPLIPSVNDTDEDLEAAAEFLRAHRGMYRYAEIMAYHNLGTSKESGLGRTPALTQPNASEDDKARWTEFFTRRGIEVKIE